MLIFDSESFCIPAEESEVAAVYRSSSPVSIAVEESLPSCEAFVCILERDQRHQVFAALHVRDIKRNLIYVVEPSGEQSTSSDPEKALAFVEAMGFSMDAVNLKYGKAMREVVLRSIPVLLSPENLERTRNEKETELSELNRVVAAAAEEPDDAAEQSDPGKQADMKRAAETRKSAANAAARKLAQEKSAADKAAAVGELVQKFLLHSNGSEVAHVDRAERERLREENTAMEKRAAELARTVSRLKEQAENDRAEAQRRIAELEAEVGKNLKEAEAARTGQEGITREKEAGEKRIADLEQALREVREELEAEKGRGKEWARTKKALENQILELGNALSEAASKEETQSPPVADLTQAEERIARLEQEVSEARETAEAERFERELLVREKAAAQRRIEELETGGGGNAGLPETSKGGHHLEIEKRLAEMESAAGQARDQLKTERTERQRLEAERISFEKRILEMEEALRKTAERDDAGGLHPSRHGTASAPPPRIVRRPPPKDAFFHVDWDLGSVEYESPEDILEVHQSMNMAQLSLEGYHGQHCLAWIVGLKKGKSRQVHVVFALSESGLNLIYSPANPIRNNEDYKRALSEAVKFLEVVGYLPEKVSLKKSPSEQGDALKSIPVLQVTRKKAQGF